MVFAHTPIRELTVDDLCFDVRWSPRRRTIGLTVARDGGLRVLAPAGTSPRRLERVVRQKLPWVRRKLAEFEAMGPPPAAPALVDGERMPYLGRTYRLRLVDRPAAPFALFDVRPGSVVRSRREAADFGLPACRAADLKGADAAYNAARLAAVLRGQERGAHRDALVMGAALVLEATGLAADPLEAAAAAGAAIDDGRASRVLDALAAFGTSQGR